MKSLVWGNKDFKVTSPFGMRDGVLHDGVDLGMPIGTPLYAPRDGTVQDLIDQFGANYQFITYPDGSGDLLVHLKAFVLSGQVRKGMLISLSGNTGQSSGPHLHFTHRTKAGDPKTAVDPTTYLQGGGVTMDPKDAEIKNLKAAIKAKDTELDSLKNLLTSKDKQIANLQAQVSSGTITGGVTVDLTGIKKVTFTK